MKSSFISLSKNADNTENAHVSGLMNPCLPFSLSMLDFCLPALKDEALGKATDAKM